MEGYIESRIAEFDMKTIWLNFEKVKFNISLKLNEIGWIELDIEKITHWNWSWNA